MTHRSAPGQSGREDSGRTGVLARGKPGSNRCPSLHDRNGLYAVTVTPVAGRRTPSNKCGTSSTPLARMSAPDVGNNRDLKKMSGDHPDFIAGVISHPSNPNGVKPGDRVENWNGQQGILRDIEMDHGELLYGHVDFDEDHGQYLDPYLNELKKVFPARGAF